MTVHLVAVVRLPFLVRLRWPSKSAAGSHCLVCACVGDGGSMGIVGGWVSSVESWSLTFGCADLVATLLFRTAESFVMTTHRFLMMLLGFSYFYLLMARKIFIPQQLPFYFKVNEFISSFTHSRNRVGAKIALSASSIVLYVRGLSDLFFICKGTHLSRV